LRPENNFSPTNRSVSCAAVVLLARNVARPAVYRNRPARAAEMPEF